MVAFVIRVIKLHMFGTFPFVTMVAIFTNIMPVILWVPTLHLFLWLPLLIQLPSLLMFFSCYGCTDMPEIFLYAETVLFWTHTIASHNK
jgi:hypothetical protein